MGREGKKKFLCPRKKKENSAYMINTKTNTIF